MLIEYIGFNLITKNYFQFRIKNIIKLNNSKLLVEIS